MTTLARCRGPVAACLLACVAVSPLATAGAPAQPSAGPVLRLPDMTVKGAPDLPPPESWRYAQIEGFEVLSNATDKTTRDLLTDFQKFRQGVRLIWPMPLKPLAAASIIVCARQNKFDAFLPTGNPADDLNKVSLFLHNHEQIAIIVDLEAGKISIGDPTALAASGGDSAEFNVDSYSQLYREYVHFLLSQVDIRPPAWLEEGLAQIVMDIKVNDESLIYGKIDSDKGGAAAAQFGELDGNDPTTDSGAVVGEQPFNVVLQHQKLMPLDKFFALTHESPEAQNPLGNNLWAKQAYAFVHFCLFGENLRYKDSLVLFLQRLAREPASDALFKECFKVSYADMGRQLRGYILYPKHKYQKYALKPEDRVGRQYTEVREATPAEVGVLKGDALRLAGHSEAAKAAYHDAYLRGERAAPLLAGLGLTESEPAHARELLEASVQAGVNRPSAYVELARRRLAQLTDAKLDPAQVASVLSLLFNARKNPPPLPETYELIAATWARSAVAPTGDNLLVLDEGIKLFPRDDALEFAAIQLYASIGATAKAGAIALFGLRYADDVGKTRLQGVLATPAPPAKP